MGRSIYSPRRKSRVKSLFEWAANEVKERPIMLVAFSILSLLVLSLAIFFTLQLTGASSALQPIDSTTVEITYDKQKRLLPTTAKTVGELLDKLNITLRDGDRVEPSRATEIAGDTFRVNVYRGMPVVVTDGSQKSYAVSAATTPRSVARQIGLTVYPEDRVEVQPPGNFVQNYSLGKEISIERSVPVNLNLYGTHTATRTLAKTVDGLIKEKNIKLPKGSSVHPAGATPINPNTQVFVLAEGISIKSEEEVVGMPVQTVDDNNLSFGVTAVRQQGSVGKRLVTYQLDAKTGAKTQIQAVVVQEPVTQVVARGTYINIAVDKQQAMSAAGIPQSDWAAVDYIISRESGWKPGSVNAGGCAGLGQACPGSKLINACPNWRTDTTCQLNFFGGYAKGRYGTWQGAYNFWISHHWW